ncbi:MAG: histidine triad nucleotide-binding protein [Candidatus Yanofskybacteria bacterium]|nr:histidine triad nucleotide-binding protein [Candidatus Yanofskybacteria bacterium]
MIQDVFCKILNKELPSDIVAEDNGWIAINDIHPQAPVHVLIIPRKHLADICSVTENDAKLLGELMMAASQVAKKLGLEEKGFRLIINHGEHGGQLVPHLHVHLLGGKKLGAKIVSDTK